MSLGGALVYLPPQCLKAQDLYHVAHQTGGGLSAALRGLIPAFTQLWPPHAQSSSYESGNGIRPHRPPEPPARLPGGG